jgi:uncharacterized protein (DUF362 family)/Pyruvate/2-oxoacid:ferredoxin oxidoreductase delta subunit
MSLNNKIAIRRCDNYDLERIIGLIAEIYEITGGPDPGGKKVLLKPNILLDSDPSTCITTNPVVVEAMIRYLQSRGATVTVGDSPSIHTRNFSPEKSGISAVCERTGVSWTDFRAENIELKLNKGSIKVTAAVRDADLLISLPKFKNHELMYFTGAIKNTLGFVPGFIKGKQHALYQNRNRFGEFLVDLNEALLPHYFLMDAVIGMEGPGPARGMAKKVGLLIGSTNPLVLDITASSIAGYEPMVIPTNKTAFFRKKWMKSEDDIVYDGPDPEDLKIRDFTKVPISVNSNISVQFVVRRIKGLRKLEKRPVFISENCTGCHKCVKICPVNAITPDTSDPKHIILTDSKCIRCFCCSEVCTDNAVQVRRKVFGV